MEALLSRLISLKEPSLKRDDLLSVLEALAQRKIFPKEIYEQVLNNLKQILEINNILLVSSKYIAIQLILQNIQDKYQTLYSSNDINSFYFNQFKGFFTKIIPIDINQYSLYFNPVILSELNKSILFFSYNLGYPVDIEFISNIDILSIADLSGSLFTKFQNKYLIDSVDFAICSLKDEEIITSGDGALIFVKDRKIYEKIYQYALYNNLFLSDFNSSLLLSQIMKKDKIVLSRNKIFFKLFNETKEYSTNVSWFDSRKILEKYSEDQLIKDATFTTFTIDVEDISIAEKIAIQIGLEISPSIKIPLSLELKLSNSFPNTEKVAKHAVFIPFYPLLNEQDLDKISYFIKKVNNY